MSNTIDNLVESFGRLPRALQWALGAVLLTALVIAWDEYVATLAERWTREADRIESSARAVAGSAELKDRIRGASSAIVAHGAVERPPSDEDGRAALNRAVVAVLRKHSVSDDSFQLNAGRKLPMDVSQSIVEGSQRLSQVTGDLQFDATPEEAIAVIADLESSPEITTVNTVRLEKSELAKVHVSVAVEAWVKEPQRARS